MNALRREARLLLDLLVMPRDALRRIASLAPIATAIVALGALQAGLLATQATLLEPVLRTDPLLADTTGGADAAPARYWMARGAAIALWPLCCALRGLALAALLQSTGALLGTPVAWRALLSLAVHLELVFWFENVAVTVLLATDRPASLDALRHLHLHAGLDLVWQPASRFAAAFLEAANLFTLWWGVLLALGLMACLRLGRLRAAGVATGAWAALVLLRCVFALR